MAEDPRILQEPEAERGIISWPEFGFTLLFLLIAVISWVGITLAELHLYRWKPLLLSSLLVSAAGGYFALRSFRGSLAAYKAIPTSSWVYLLAILAAGAVFFFQPGEYLFNGSDGSVYVNTGKMIERTGGITFSDPLLDTVPQSVWAGLFSRDHNWPTLYNRFPGGVQIAESKNLILPNFFHLFPVWVATFDLLFGPRGGFYVNSVFGLLSLLALWLLGHRLSSPLAGTLAAGLLLCNFGQLWYARFPTSEILTQFFVLTGLYLTVLCVDGAPPVVGLLAGAAFGLAAFCRLDVLFLVSPLVLAFLGVVALEGRWSRPWGWYLGGFALLTGQAVGHAMIIARAYTWRILFRLADVVTQVSMAMEAFLFIAAFVAVYLMLHKYRTSWTGLKPYLPVLQGAVLALLALRLWPHLWSGYLSLLFTPLGVMATFAGFMVVVMRDASLRSLLPIAVFVVSAMFYLERPRTAPFLPWIFRRYVPVLLPLSILFIGHLIGAIWSSRIRRRALGLLIPAILGTFFLVRSWPILKTPPMQGVYSVIEKLASQFPPDALLLFDRSAPSHLAHAMEATFGRQALAVYRPDGMPAAMRELVGRVLGDGRPAFVITTGREGRGGNSLWRSDLLGFAVRPVGTFSLRYTALEGTREVFPHAIRPIEHRLELYQVLPPHDPAVRVSLPLRIDLGTLDFPYLLDGFYDREEMGGSSFRWTQGEAQLLLPPLVLPPRSGVTLVLRASGSRPPGMKPPVVTLALNGMSFGEFVTVPHDFAVHRVPLPPRLLGKGGEGEAILTLRTTTFVPKDVGLNDDSRELGIVLDWVAVEEEAAALKGRQK